MLKELTLPTGAKFLIYALSSFFRHSLCCCRYNPAFYKNQIEIGCSLTTF